MSAEDFYRQAFALALGECSSIRNSIRECEKWAKDHPASADNWHKSADWWRAELVRAEAHERECLRRVKRAMDGVLQ